MRILMDTIMIFYIKNYYYILIIKLKKQFNYYNSLPSTLRKTMEKSNVTPKCVAICDQVCS